MNKAYFRKLAKRAHPDGGGTSDQFIELMQRRKGAEKRPCIVCGKPANGMRCQMHHIQHRFYAHKALLA